MALLWLVVGLALLWFWLSGYWFGRALVTIAVGGFGLLVIAAAEGVLNGQMLGIAIMAAAWPIASAPAWVWRARARAKAEEMEHITARGMAMLHPDVPLTKPHSTYPDRNP